jgi:hypothetical protein
MPQARASPGQDIYNSPFGSHRTQNEVLAAVEVVRRLQRARPVEVPELGPGQVRVKNSSGASRALGSVLQLDDKLVTTLGRYSQALDGIEPDTQGALHVAVALHQHPTDAILPCQAQGVCVARVNVVHTADRCCYVENGSYVLKGCAIGHHRILNVPQGTGEQLCLVGLGTGVLSCFGLADAAIVSGASGTVRVYAGTPGSESDTGQTISAYNYGPDIADEQEVTVSILHGQFYTAALSCD